MMKARLQTQAKPQGTRVLTGFARPARPFTPLSEIIDTAKTHSEPSAAGRGHDFGQIRVHRAATITMSDCPPSMIRHADAGDAGVPMSTLTAPDAGAAAAAKPTLALADDKYTDSTTESHKKIKFDVTVPSGLAAKDYALVNHLKGFQKNGDGSYFKVKMYGSTVDFNFASWQVDSVDADPVYWSDSSARWNYSTSPTGFYATDDPGPALSSEHGAAYAVNFKIGLYKLADLPTTTSGTISAKAIDEKPWQYSVTVSKTGTFDHPAI